jgi:hypothetical protein
VGLSLKLAVNVRLDCRSVLSSASIWVKRCLSWQPLLVVLDKFGGSPHDGGNSRPNPATSVTSASSAEPSSFSFQNQSDVRRPESHVKCTGLCIEPNAKPLKLFRPQSQPKMLSDIGASASGLRARKRGACRPAFGRWRAPVVRGGDQDLIHDDKGGTDHALTGYALCNARR